MKHLVRQAALTLFFLSSACSEKKPSAKLSSQCWPDLKDGEINTIEAIAWVRGGELALSHVCSHAVAQLAYTRVEDADSTYRLLTSHMRQQGTDLLAFRLKGLIHVIPVKNGISFGVDDVRSVDILNNVEGDALVRQFETISYSINHSLKPKG